MKINRSSLKYITVIAGILVGVLVMAQFRTATPLGSSYPVDQIEAQKDLIKSYVNDEVILKSRIGTLREKINTSLEQNKLVSQTSNLENLNILKEEIGLTELKGEGFKIELDDSLYIDRENISPEEAGIVFAADIRDIVNLLRAHNVEGIAINDQRVIATSPITSVGNTVMVNNSNLTPPFTITAIGDYGSFIIRLSEIGTLTDLQKRVKENGIQFRIDPMNHVILPIYNGQFRLKFITAANGEV
ncbi:DUF881 domain-containing protein [Patescibacteria group bacterium]